MSARCQLVIACGSASRRRIAEFIFQISEIGDRQDVKIRSLTCSQLKQNMPDTDHYNPDVLAPQKCDLLV